MNDWNNQVASDLTEESFIAFWKRTLQDYMNNSLNLPTQTPKGFDTGFDLEALSQLRKDGNY
jgi:hypothetical protein